jgi:hypothetical protein
VFLSSTCCASKNVVHGVQAKRTLQLFHYFICFDSSHVGGSLELISFPMDFSNFQQIVLPWIVLLLIWHLVKSTAFKFYKEESSALIFKGVILPWKYQLRILFHITLFYGLQQWTDKLGRFQLYLIIIACACCFYPYLRKPSPYLYNSFDGLCVRCWDHKLVTTSYVYLAGFVYTMYLGYYQLAALCLITTLGSVLYHRNREGKYFNLDNIFATSHAFIFAYTWYHSWSHDSQYFYMSSIAIPFALFPLIYCGDPAIVKEDCPAFRLPKDSKKYIRRSLDKYDEWHVYWHFVSALGPILTAYYFTIHHILQPYYCLKNDWNLLDIFLNNTMYDHYTSSVQQECIIVFLAVCISACLNIFLNILGAVPFN